MPFSFLCYLECSRCRTTYDADTTAQLCVCGSPLLAHYDLDAARHFISTMKAGYMSPSEHIQAIRRYKEAIAS